MASISNLLQIQDGYAIFIEQRSSAICFFAVQSSIYSTKNLDDNEWYIFKDSNTVEIVYKSIVPLGAIANITPGIQTGCDKLSLSHISTYSLSINKYIKDEGIFVLNDDEIKKFNEDELKHIRPMYKNSDIQKWKTETKNSKWILITNDIDNIELYPNIKFHLLKFKQILDGRYRNFALLNADKEGKWWYLYGYRPNTNFEGEKIINANRAIGNVFTYSKEPFYATMDLFFTIVKNPNLYKTKYILAVLNSKFINYWLSQNCKKKGQMYELIAEPLSKIPIKIANNNIQNEFVLLVDEIFALNKNDSQYIQVINNINKKVYELYELTNEEIDLIEGGY